MATEPKVFVYVFCGGCGKEVDSTLNLCATCEKERDEQLPVKLKKQGHTYSALLPLNSNMSSFNITPEQIKQHRAGRKAAGLYGCKNGADAPLDSLKGISWRPADPMNPSCFCHDCRDTWDNDASVDIQLIETNNKDARWTYASLLPADAIPPKEAPNPALALPMRSNGGGVGWGSVPRFSDGGYDSTDDEDSLVTKTRAILHDTSLRIDTSAPRYGSFDEVPRSLPAPRHRDVMNESPAERLKNDLAELRGQIQSKILRTMDKRRRGVYLDEPERSEYLQKVYEEENALLMKLEAVNLLLKE